MFGKAKTPEYNYIMAIKDYTKTVDAIKGGTFYVPFNKEIYFKLFENQGAKVDDVKELGKFIKTSKKDKKEVLHFWEGLITRGYSLIGVRYDESTPSFDKLCNNDSIKYVCKV